MLSPPPSRSWCLSRRAITDSVHEAFHVCAPSRSTCARSHSIGAAGGEGEIARSHLGPVHGGGSIARYRRRPRPAVRRLPACFLAARLSSRRGARSEDRHLNSPGSVLPDALSARQSER